MTNNIFVIYIFVFILLPNKGSFQFNNIVATLDKTMRIIGGHSTSIIEHPYMASIRHDDRFICGGTVISHSCMLTAAHCSLLESPQSWEIHAGTSFIKTKDMDVAIAVLDKPLNIKHIRAIELDFSPLKENEQVVVAGWGLKKEYSLAKLSNKLQAVNVSLTSISKCTKAYQAENNITQNMFCAIGSWGSDACQGDSGGPAIRMGKQVGIVSWGYRCGSPQYPGVYTRLSSFHVKRFLTDVITNNC